MGTHAILSPSAGSRWTKCTPSARLEMGFPDTAGIEAERGTLVHALGEMLINYRLKRVPLAETDKKLLDIQANPLYDRESMYTNASDYANFVIEQFNTAKRHTPDAQLFVEEEVDMTDYIPEGFGTADAIIVADDVLDFTDYKNGKGVAVSSEENTQMKIYALGILKKYSWLFGIKRVRLTIFQPRIDNTSTWEISVENLERWGEDFLIPKAKLAFAGEGEFVPGEWCRFCKAKAACRANMEYNTKAAQKAFTAPELLSAEEIGDLLLKAPMLVNWAKSVADYALNQAVNNGAKYPGMKVVEGRANRKYSDEWKVIKELTAQGFKLDKITKTSILGLGALEKAITKKVFTDVVTPFLIQPPGAPALVPESDKRPAWFSAEGAKIAFEDVDLEQD